jgi:hypothetical protein
MNFNHTSLERVMQPAIQAGAILINDWPPGTPSLSLESEPFSGNWRLVQALDGFALDRRIHSAGWNFFFMAAEVKVTFFGALGAKKIQSALNRILRKVKQQNFNSLEVTGIVAKRFLGIPYATVSAIAAICSIVVIWMVLRPGGLPSAMQNGQEVERLLQFEE